MTVFKYVLFILTVDLKRSKSTPGLVESSGKVPMLAASITRHHTLPAGLPTHSASTNNLGMAEPTTCDSVNVSGTAEAVQVNVTETEDQRGHDTQIRTVSSVTSFLTGSPLLRSPINVDNQAPMFHFSPPLTPGLPAQYPSPYVHQSSQLVNTCMVESAPYNDYIPRDASHDIGSRMQAQFQQMQYPYNQFSSPISSTNSHHQQIAYLSPFCASPAYIPSVSPTGVPVTKSISTSAQSSQSYFSTATPRGSLQPTVEGQTSVSPAQLYNEASHDTLVQEITRLRERLKSVESENAMMAAKLNQQQWELEHRLSELEMHMTCTSDLASTGSTDDRSNPFENISRESMI